MAKVRKGGIVIEARDEIQLDAFINNGWSVVEEAKSTPPLFTVKPADEPQEERRRVGRRKRESGEIG